METELLRTLCQVNFFLTLKPVPGTESAGATCSAAQRQDCEDYAENKAAAAPLPPQAPPAAASRAAAENPD